MEPIDLSKFPLARTAVCVRVPATSANLGSGFDSIGIALDVWNEVTVELSPASTQHVIEVIGEGQSELPQNDENLIIVGIKAAFTLAYHMEKKKKKNFYKDLSMLRTSDFANLIVLPPLQITCRNAIPIARGLGSSSAAILAGLLAGFVLLGIDVPVRNKEVLLNLACAIEGHPDNVAPALYGGIQVGVKYKTNTYMKQSAQQPVDQHHWNSDNNSSLLTPICEATPSTTDSSPGSLTQIHRSVNDHLSENTRKNNHDSGHINQDDYVNEHIDEVFSESLHNVYEWITSEVRCADGLQCILFLPDFTTQTTEARNILPNIMSRADAIFNASRTALLVNALTTGRFEQLKIAMEDTLHQPYRAKHLIPYLYHMIKAAEDAGAYGACLSGAGPSILSFTSAPKGDIYSQRKVSNCNSAVAAAMISAALKEEITGKILITQPTLRGAYIHTATPPFSNN